tara:strand:- start:22 stop:960 length:939 start_codon:yes stop_codon:yes gene_type:complete
MSDKSKYIWFNGGIIPWEDAQVHVMSHVLHYGSGVFEGIKCYNTDHGGAIFKLNEHIDRLFESASTYNMKIPFSKQEIVSGCIDITNKNSLSDCYIRPIAFYGYDTLGVHPKDCPVSVAIASFYWGAYLGDEGILNGVKLTVSPWRKFSYKSMPSTAKASGQYMNSLLAVRDARTKGFDEALLLNEDENIAEGSGQNIFYVKNGELFTNDEKSSILMGITRETIIDIASDIGIKTNITNLTLEDTLNADEAFFSGTASEVTPIKSIDNELIADGNPGEITLKLRKMYLDIVQAKNERYNEWLSFINQHEHHS